MTKRRIALTLATLASALVGPFAHAQGQINVAYLQWLEQTFAWVVNYLLVPGIITLAFLIFIWGAYKYFILGAENEGQRADGRKFLMWSLIGFVVIFSLWGLVGLVGTAFNLQPGGSAPPYPTL